MHEQTQVHIERVEYKTGRDFPVTLKIEVEVFGLPSGMPELPLREAATAALSVLERARDQSIISRGNRD